MNFEVANSNERDFEKQKQIEFLALNKNINSFEE